MSGRNKQRGDRQPPAADAAAKSPESTELPGAEDVTAETPEQSSATDAEEAEAPPEASPKSEPAKQGEPDTGPVECVVQPGMGSVACGPRWYGSGERLKLSQADFARFGKLGIVKRV